MSIAVIYALLHLNKPYNSRLRSSCCWAQLSASFTAEDLPSPEKRPLRWWDQLSMYWMFLVFLSVVYVYIGYCHWSKKKYNFVHAYIHRYIHPVTVGRYCFFRCLYLQLLKILCLRCPRCPVLQKVHQRLFSSILSIPDCLIAACLNIFPLISLRELLGTTLAGTAVSTVTEKVCACE